MAQKASSKPGLRIFFLYPGMSAHDYPRVMMLCHVCIEISKDTFRVVKNKFTGFQGKEYPISHLHEYINELEAIENGMENI